ncbi:MAG: hypothetical protein J1E79_06970 [Rikenella sp.]|nr:hypothetical protein [Rikenella sp.]
MSRITYSVKNVKVSLTFYMLVLVLNFFSRRVFLETLGNDLVGLSETVVSYIGFLNLAEMGISVAIANVLYAPLFRGDREQVVELVSLLGWLFRLVGIVIGAAGLIFAAFIPWIFAKDIETGLDLGMIYAAYLTFLTTTLLSYLVNYKQNLLVADQKGYAVAKVFNLCLIGKVLLQMALLRWCGAGYLTWLGLEVVFGVVFAVWLEAVVRRVYPWLHASVRTGRELVRKYREVFAGVRRIFAHRIAGFALVQSDKLVIAQLLSLSMVAFYTNYSIIINRVTAFITGTLQNSYAGVGNLVAEGNREKVRLVFWQFNAMYFWMGGTLAFAFYRLINPFIVLWLPPERYVLFSGPVVLMLVGTLFIGVVRQTVQYFLNAYGLYHDVWAAWTEAGLNVAVSIWGCLYYGVAGVVAGTLLSTGLAMLVWKPYFLYKRGFRDSSREYWLTLLKYLAIIAGVWFLTDWIADWGWLPSVKSWGGWAVHAVVIPLLYAVLCGGMLWLVSRGMRDFAKLVRKTFS